jgi:hypothetical protein
VDVDKKLIGEGIGTREYTIKAVDLAEEVQQLRLLQLAITARVPHSAVAAGQCTRNTRASPLGRALCDDES